jgi:hypothetical protein
MFDALRRVLAEPDPHTDGDGQSIWFIARPPATPKQIAHCEAALRRTLPDEYARFLAEWNGVHVFRGGPPSERTRHLEIMGTEDLVSFARYAYVGNDPDQWGPKAAGSDHIFACVHALSTDGADFLGYDLAEGTFVDLPGYVAWHTRQTRTIAPSFDSFLDRFVAERLTYFWIYVE